MDRVSLKVAVHFIRTYGDRCPRGREDILFRQLAKKRVSDEAAAIMAEFVEEHAYRRRTMGELVRAKERTWMATCRPQLTPVQLWRI